MAFDQARGNLVIFGGTDDFPPYQNGVRLAQTYIWSPSTRVTSLAATSASPSARQAPGVVYNPHDQTVLLFGGLSDRGLENDTWTWDGIAWTQRHPEHAPSARSEPNLVYDPIAGRVVLFGGVNDAYQNDTWAWNGSDWIQLNPTHSPPVSHNSQAMAYFSAQDEIILLAVDETGVPQTYTFDGGDWTTASTQSPGSTFGTMSSFGSDVVLFQYPGSVWLWDGTWNLIPASACAPPDRRLSASAFDPVTGDFLIFGGLSYDATHGYADLWAWTNNTGWQQLA